MPRPGRFVRCRVRAGNPEVITAVDESVDRLGERRRQIIWSGTGCAAVAVLVAARRTTIGADNRGKPRS